MLSPQSPTYFIPLPAAPQSNCLNFKLIIRYKGREQSLNVPSFEDISNLYKIGLKKAHIKESDIVACINVQRLRVLRINGKLRDQINNGETIWYCTNGDWDEYVKILSKDAPIRHGKKVIPYPNPKSLPQQNLWEFIQSNYLKSNTLDEIDLHNDDGLNQNNNIDNSNSNGSISYNSSPSKSIEPEKQDNHNYSPTNKYGKPEIVHRKYKKIVPPLKIFTYKHQTRTKLTASSLQLHNQKQKNKIKIIKNGDNNDNDESNQDNDYNYDDKIVNNNDKINEEDDNIKSNDNHIIKKNTNNGESISLVSPVSSKFETNFNKNSLSSLKKKIQNSPRKSLQKDMEVSVNSSSDNLFQDEKKPVLFVNTNSETIGNRISDDSSEDSNENVYDNDISSHMEDHNLSESLEKSYIDDLHDNKKIYPSLSYDNNDLDEEKTVTEDNDESSIEQNITPLNVEVDKSPVTQSSITNDSILLKEQADELEEERRVRAILEARLQESRIMLQLLAGQNLVNQQRRKSHNDIDVLEKTIEGVGEVHSAVNVDTISPSTRRTASPAFVQKSSTPKIIKSIRRANNKNSTPVISISLSHLLEGEFSDSVSSPKNDTVSNEVNDNTKIDTVSNNIQDSSVSNANDMNDENNNSNENENDANMNHTDENNSNKESNSSEKSKSGSIFNSLMSVFQRKKSDKKTDTDSSSFKAIQDPKLENGTIIERGPQPSTNEDNIDSKNVYSFHHNQGTITDANTNTTNDNDINNDVKEEEIIPSNDDNKNVQIIDAEIEEVKHDTKTPIAKKVNEISKINDKYNNNNNNNNNNFLSPIERNFSLTLTPGMTPSQFRDFSMDDLGLSVDNANQSLKTSELLQLLSLDPTIIKNALLLGKSLSEILKMTKVGSDVSSVNEKRRVYDGDINKPSRVESYYTPFYLTLRSQELRRHPYQLRVSHEDIALFTVFQLYGKMEGGLLVSNIRLSNITKALQDIKIIGASLLTDKKIETILRKTPYTTKSTSSSLDGSTFISPTANKVLVNKKAVSINSNALLSPQFSKQYSFEQFRFILSTVVPVIIKSAIHQDDIVESDLQIFETIKLSIKLWLIGPTSFSNSYYKQVLDDSKVCLSGLIKPIVYPSVIPTNTNPTIAKNSNTKRKSITLDLGTTENYTNIWGCNVNPELIRNTRLLWEKNIEQAKNIFIGYGTSIVGQRSNSPNSHHNTNNINIATSISFDECREMLIDFDVIPAVLDQQTFAKIFRSCKLWEWYIAASLDSKRTNADELISTTNSDETNITSSMKSSSPTRKKNIQSLNDFLLKENHQRASSPLNLQQSCYLCNLSNYNDEYDIMSSVGSFNLTFLGLIELLTRIACFGGRLGDSPRVALEHLLRIMNSSNGKFKLANSRKKKVTCIRNFII